MIDPVALLKEYHAALNAFDLDKVDQLFEDNALYISDGLHGALIGRGVIMAAMKKYFDEYTDQLSHDEEIGKIDSNTAWSRWSLKATSVLSGQTLNRKGTEKIHFSNRGHIMYVEVKDE
jgi:SnoaL-like domain